MADELIEGMLGGEDEASDRVASETPAGAEAFAAAIAAIASRQDPQVARDTSIFLKKQARLLDLQAEHLEDEHASRLMHLRLTVAAAKRKRYADRMRNGLYTCIALIVLGVLIAGVRMTVQAMNDHSLVVEDFTVPADFAARGVTGQALAEDLASRVADIRATAVRESGTQSNDVRADQASILKVQIPETGISIDELERFMHRWLGHQTVLSGELRNEADGQLSMILHIAGDPPLEAKGPATALDQVIQQVAEKAFEAVDPVNYSNYLANAGRPLEALQALEGYVGSPRLLALPLPQRAEMYGVLSLREPDRQRGLAIAQIAINLDPRDYAGSATAALASSELGHQQAELDFNRQALGTKLKDTALVDRAGYAGAIAAIRVRFDWLVGNFTALDADLAAEYRAPYRMSPSALYSRYADSAQTAALLHDETRSRQELARAVVTGPLDDIVWETRWYVSSAAGDWAQALFAAKALVADTEAQKAAAPGPDWAGRQELDLQTLYRPRLAYAQAMTGETASAKALISQTPTDCYLCISTRGLVAAAAGDAAGADRWFAEAVRQGPDLPMAYFQWGQALLNRGDLVGATREFNLAHQKGPHFADPLKGLGDVLLKQGQPQEALAKYDEALRYAPNWAALKQARNAAAAMTEHRT